MEEFNRLVGMQLQTMDRLLYMQDSIERLQIIESQVLENKRTMNDHTFRVLTEKKELYKKELKNIQAVFDEQTEKVIKSYQTNKIQV